VNETLRQTLDVAIDLLKQKKYQEVIDTIRPILIQETGGEGQKLYGMALLGLGQHFDAVQPLMAASQMLPNDVTVAFAYGSALTQQGNLEGARAAYERALGIDETHPGSKMGYNNASKALADRDLAASPMKAIEWLYGPWQREPGNPQWAGPIIDIYLANGWNDQAHQFAGMLPQELQNAPSLKEKLKNAPAGPPVVAQAPAGTGPLATATVAAAENAPRGGAVSALEQCPFCHQQIMAGIHTCPFCKMVIRSKNMPGQDYKPDWQEVTLNILCWIGILLNVTTLIMAFVNGTYNQPSGGYSIITSTVALGANALILQRNDMAMSIGKILYTIRFLSSAFCFCSGFMGAMSSEKGGFQAVIIVGTIIAGVDAIYSAFMVYLLNHEGAD
jgi:hypothetical protein